MYRYGYLFNAEELSDVLHPHYVEFNGKYVDLEWHECYLMVDVTDEEINHLKGKGIAFNETIDLIDSDEFDKLAIIK